MKLSRNNILSHSIFGGYRGKENQVTAAFLHMLERGGEPLLRYVVGSANELLPENTINIETQLACTSNGAEKSVFDGIISCRFSFTYIIESKVDNNPLTKDQVDKYHHAIQNKEAKLFALTSDASIPSCLWQGDIWLSWTMLADALKAYESENKDEILLYLIEQFILLLNNLGLYDEWKNRVIIVGGSFGEDVALKYGFYACQNHRYFKRAKYLAFAYKNMIRHLFEIVDGPENDVDIAQAPSIPPAYFQEFEPYYKVDMRELFHLKEIKALSIQNDNVDKNGKRCAFVQNQTYTTYEKIISAQLTSEL